MRLDVAPRRGGWSRDHPVLSDGRRGGALRGRGHRHRHSAREAEDHLRGVPAGRRRHQPQVRRHGPRSRDQPRAREPARRRDPAAQHAGRGQHVHALPAAAATSGAGAVDAVASRPDAPKSPRARGSSHAVRAHRAVARQRSPTIARASQPGDHVLLIVEDDPHYARDPRRSGARPGLQGAGREPRRRRARPRARVPADRGLARRVPARHARLDGAQPAEAGPGDAPHPGADRDARRGPPARPRARRVRFVSKPTTTEGLERRAVADQGVRDAAAQAAAGGRGQCRRAA